MVIEYSSYQLEAKKNLYANQSAANINGYLVRIHFDDGLCGYTCLQTWPHLGEESLETALNDLKATSLESTKGLIELARIDALAREAKTPLIDENFLIGNYYSLGELSSINEVPSYFASIKWKWPKDLKQIDDNKKALHKFTNKIDMNFKNIENFSILEGLDIDYIEDIKGSLPHMYQQAFDQFKPKEQKGPFVIKPIKEWAWLKTFKPKNRVIFTSNMDHPLGQIQALYGAQNFYKKWPKLKEDCGLATHLLFKKNSYSDRLQIKEKYLIASEGYGFGFDDLLEKEVWKKL